MDPFPSPMDEFNRRLIQYVHPQNWKNPDPQPVYDMVVIGGGTAGLVTAAGSAGVGAKVALIEKSLLGGDCLNYGCVPSKALLHAAKQAHAAKTSGMALNQSEFFTNAMNTLRKKRSEIAEHDSAQHFTDLSIDVFLGTARFTGPREIEVAGKKLRFKKACIASGARASLPPIPGLSETPHLTNETLFNLVDLPKNLTIIGGGPIGSEMAQAFQRLGSQVTLLNAGPQILEREDSRAAALIDTVFRREGIAIHTGIKILSASGNSDSQTVVFEAGGKQVLLQSDRILVAAGRTPNIEGLNLEVAEVQHTKHGVTVDDHLRTTNKKIFACGDVASVYKFTHLADFQARIVIQNALFFGRKKASALRVPWVTYTEPEVAHVGVYPKDAEGKGITLRRFSLDFSTVDRSKLEDETEGFAEIIIGENSDAILGATIVHPRAGEMISEITVAMHAGFGLGSLASVIHPYPTQAEILRKLGDAYNRTRLTPTAKKILGFLLKLNR